MPASTARFTLISTIKPMSNSTLAFSLFISLWNLLLNQYCRMQQSILPIKLLLIVPRDLYLSIQAYTEICQT
ncbi:hypothetical protein DFH28DRAFT_943896 [Melampsora americana]|nr:hypothetical protein DFH28DRAFT_943896 [Melampsora americana]